MVPLLHRMTTESAHDIKERYQNAIRTLEQELRLAELPPDVRWCFEQARDVLLLDHDDLGAFAACRGLERACRSVADLYGLTLTIGSNAAKPLSECDLHDILEALARACWGDGSKVLDKTERALVQFVRQMRNLAGHAVPSAVTAWRATAALAAAATCRLLARAAEPSQSIAPTAITKQW